MTEQQETGWLREAARSMREQHGSEHPRREMWAAMADLLDHAAARGEACIEHGAVPRHIWTRERDATNVAKAYLAALAAPVPSGTPHEEAK